MPIYEYNCRKCESKFEKLVKNTAAAEDAICPECGSKDTAKALSVFAAGSSGGGKPSALPKGMCGRCGGPPPRGQGGGGGMFAGGSGKNANGAHRILQEPVKKTVDATS